MARRGTTRRSGSLAAEGGMRQGGGAGCAVAMPRRGALRRGTPLPGWRGERGVVPLPALIARLTQPPGLWPRWEDGGTVGRKTSPKMQHCVLRKFDYMSRCVTPTATTYVAFEPVSSGITGWCLPGPQRAPHRVSGAMPALGRMAGRWGLLKKENFTKNRVLRPSQI